MVIEFYYHDQSPPSQAVWMLLKELEIPHKANYIDLWTEEHKKKSYTEINKYQVVPAIVDGDLTLSESHAIAIYLCNKYEAKDKKEKLYPTDINEIAKFNRIMFRNLDNYQTVLKYLDPDDIYAGKSTGPREDLFDKVTVVLKEVDDLLSGNQYIFRNHLTFLDLFILTTIGFVEVKEIDWKTFPNIKTWRSTMEKLPYYEECHAKGTKSGIKDYKKLCEEVKSAKK